MAGKLASYGVEMEYFMKVRQSRCNRITGEGEERVTGEGSVEEDEGVLDIDAGFGGGDFEGGFVGLNEDAEIDIQI